MGCASVGNARVRGFWYWGGGGGGGGGGGHVVT